MNEFITYVVAHHVENPTMKFLWKVPTYATLHKGDLAVARTKFGDKLVEIDSADIYIAGSSHEEMLLTLIGDRKVKELTAYYTKEEFRNEF